MASIPLKLLALATPTLFGFGFALDEQRLHDPAPPLQIDHVMDARLTAYIPLIKAGTRRSHPTLSQVLELSSQWSEGLRSGRLQNPLPSRYGDKDGARTEVTTEAFRLSGALASAARTQKDPAKALQYFAAAVAPLRAVQYSDCSILNQVHMRRRWLTAAMEDGGFEPKQIAKTLDCLRPQQAKLADLMSHMVRLRSQYIVRFGDDGHLREVDPYFEGIVQTNGQHRILARR